MFRYLCFVIVLCAFNARGQLKKDSLFIVGLKDVEVHTLYQGCLNELEIGGIYNSYRIEISNCDTIIKSVNNNRCLIQIIPKSAKEKVVFSVWDSLNNKVLVSKFSVIAPPAPKIHSWSVCEGNVLRSALKKMLEVDTISMKCLKHYSLSITCKADGIFSAFLPKDARYCVAKWEASLIRNHSVIKQVTYESCGSAFQEDMRTLTKQGVLTKDMIKIRILKISRKDGLDRVVDCPMPKEVSWQIIVI